MIYESNLFLHYFKGTMKKNNSLENRGLNITALLF